MTEWEENFLLPNLKRRLKQEEGFRSKPYMDSTGNLTIGYGRNLSAKGINRKEADYLLTDDVLDAIRAFNNSIFADMNLDYNRQCVIIDMIFNMGLAGVMSFKKMIEHLIRRNYLEAADEMLHSKWAQQVKSRATFLAKVMRGEVKYIE